MKIDYIKQESKTSKGGNPFILISIKSGDKWYNGFGKRGISDNWQVGDEVEVITYQEEYNGKMYDKFKIPTLQDKFDDLEKRVEKLEKNSI